MKKIGFMPMRVAPPHKGHIKAIKKMLEVERFDEVILGIGSCYEVGSERYPLLAIYREKMILNGLKTAGIDMDKVDIVHLQDFRNFEEWLDHVMIIAKRKNVTHFITGNEKDILSVLEQKGIELPFEFINPEKSSDFSYHASDLRRSIVDGDYKKFREIADPGTIALMGNVGGFGGIRRAMENAGTKFIPGRQTVDVVFTLRCKTSIKGRAENLTYVLCGRRSKRKTNFPEWLGLPGGGINTYESPVNAILRELEEETGINTVLLDNTLEPAHIAVKAGDKNILAELRFLRLFSSDDTLIIGNDGGSSQVFHIHLDAEPEIFDGILKSESDLDDVAFRRTCCVLEEGLAYQQTEMLKLALEQVKLL